MVQREVNSQNLMWPAIPKKGEEIWRSILESSNHKCMSTSRTQISPILTRNLKCSSLWWLGNPKGPRSVLCTSDNFLPLACTLGSFEMESNACSRTERGLSRSTPQASSAGEGCPAYDLLAPLNMACYMLTMSKSCDWGYHFTKDPGQTIKRF